MPASRTTQPHGDGRRPSARRLAWLLALAALVQGGLYAHRARFELERALAEGRALRSPEPERGTPPSPRYLQRLAFRSLPRLARSIPDDARVLLLTESLWPVQFEYYFLPRPFAFLQALDPSVLEHVDERYPLRAEGARIRYGDLERRGQRLTPERVERELARADYVVCFLGGERWVERRLERVTAVESASLWRTPGTEEPR